MNKNLRYFPIQFVGIIKRKNDDYPLGFMTPYEKSSAFQKRKDTVVKWVDRNAKGFNSGEARNPEYIKNELRPGFKVVNYVNRSVTNKATGHWRILDPYGYMLEIEGENLLEILQYSDILKGGEIKAKCVWGRMGPDNYLVAENTPSYEDLMKREKAKNKKTIKTTELKPGMRIRTTTGMEGTYLGRYYTFSCKREFTVHDFSFIQSGLRDFMEYEGVGKNPPKHIGSWNKLSVESILDKTTKPEQEMLAKIVKKAENGHSLKNPSAGWYGDNIFYASEEKLEIEKVYLKKVSLNDILDNEDLYIQSFVCIEYNDMHFIVRCREIKKHFDSNKTALIIRRYLGQFDNESVNFHDLAKVIRLDDSETQNLNYYRLVAKFSNGNEVFLNVGY